MKPLSCRERILEALKGQQTAHQIAYAIGMTPFEVSNALCKLRDAGKVRVARSEAVCAKGPKAHVWERTDVGIHQQTGLPDR